MTFLFKKGDKVKIKELYVNKLDGVGIYLDVSKEWGYTGYYKIDVDGMVLTIHPDRVSKYE